VKDVFDVRIVESRLLEILNAAKKVYRQVTVLTGIKDMEFRDALQYFFA